MALFPKIDQPCPLGIDAQKRIGGYCSRCDKGVHALDAMTDAERRALLRDARGSICVSYRTPSRAPSCVGFGAAVALSIASPSFATEPPILAAGSPQPLQSVETTHETSIGEGAHASGPNCHDGEASALRVIRCRIRRCTRRLRWVVSGIPQRPSGSTIRPCRICR